MRNRRIIYIHDDNIKAYDDMENKSEFINQKLRELRSNDMKDKSNEFDEKIKRLRGRSTTDGSAE